jgi:6-phosphofructokinase 1
MPQKAPRTIHIKTHRKKIAILTSGGDCAGLNAVLRAVVCRADLLGYEVIGVENGTAGLLEKPYAVRPLKPAEFDGHVMRLGGTVLGTTNSRDPFKYKMANGTYKDRSREVIAAFGKLGVHAVIGIGGDGSFDILSRMAEQGGLNFVGIPKTIDNDLAMTDLSVGFDTAVSVATEALDRLQPTAASHDRVMILEVMGRDAGHIALNAGIAGGVDIILIPEIAYSIEKIARKIKAVKKGGRNFSLMIVSEAVKAPDGKKIEVTYPDGARRYGCIAEYLAPKITAATGSEARVTVLGHVQRGASPTWNDRLVAQALGVRAVDLVQAGEFDTMVAWQKMRAAAVPVKEAIRVCRTVDPNGPLVHTARSLGISFGD